MRRSIILAGLLAVVTTNLFARGGGYSSGGRSGGYHSSGGHSYSSSGSYSSHSSSGRSYSPKSSTPRAASSPHVNGTHRSTYATGVQRDSKGHIARSSTTKHEFEKETGYPNGRPGYVVDHVVPLKRGGADTPNNMQWQTIEDAKAKDKIE